MGSKAFGFIRGNEDTDDLVRTARVIGQKKVVALGRGQWGRGGALKSS